MRYKFTIKIFSGLLLFLIIGIVFYSCKREFLNPYDDDISDNWPTVKHDTVYVDMNKITAKATVTKSISKLLQRGFCWSENHTPTIADSKIEIGGSESVSSFQANPSGLTADKTYHLRAFVTNLSRTAYSGDVLFMPQIQMLKNDVTFSAPSTNTITGIIKGTFLQGVSVAEYGICYSLNTNPVYGDSKISLGSFRKDTLFSVNIINLLYATKYYFKIYKKDSASVKYSEEYNFTTNPTVPTLTTSTISAITQTNATGGGSISVDGGASVTERGICWSTSQSPTILNSHSSDGSGLGNYTSSITGLSANTIYYVRAFATNSVGTAYGNEINFTTLQTGLPTLSTTSASSITQTTAISGGNISSDGGVSISARGVCWSTSQNPVVTGNHTSDGTGTGIFTSNITSLTVNITYYVRAYATNSLGTAYGTQISFTTSQYSLPSITTTAISSITQTSATSGGNITSDGGASITARGICWSTSQNPIISGNHTTDGTGTGSFASSLTSLAANTTYYVRAYATNSAGTAYGNQVSFTTSAITLPTLTTSSASSITQQSASCGGNITSSGGGSITARGVCWSTSQNPTIANNITSDGSGTGSFSSSLTGLLPNTTYYVRAYATNSGGTAYGNQVSFTTLTLAIGQTYAGGIIFYLDGTGQHGLVVSSTDISTSAQWGCNGTSISGATGTALGTGQSNTTAIVNACTTTGIAAKLCNDLTLNGYGDWYLPSKDELYSICSSNNLTGAYWWSSSERNQSEAWMQSGSIVTSNQKSSTARVRAIRAF